MGVPPAASAFLIERGPPAGWVGHGVQSWAGWGSWRGRGMFRGPNTWGIAGGTEVLSMGDQECTVALRLVWTRLLPFPRF